VPGVHSRLRPRAEGYYRVMTQSSRASRGARGARAHRDRGASAVEYGLLVAGITATFLIGAIALQSASKVVFDQTVTSVEKDDTAP